MSALVLLSLSIPLALSSVFSVPELLIESSYKTCFVEALEDTFR